MASGLYATVPPEIHCGSSLELICRVLSVGVLVVQPLIIKIEASNTIYIFHFDTDDMNKFIFYTVNFISLVIN